MTGADELECTPKRRTDFCSAPDVIECLQNIRVRETGRQKALIKDWEIKDKPGIMQLRTWRSTSHIHRL